MSKRRFVEVNVTDCMMNKYLPKNILETDQLSNDAKKLLCAFIHCCVEYEMPYAVMSNTVIRNTLKCCMANVKCVIEELVEKRLVERKKGRTRMKGEKSMASEYTVLFDNLVKPIRTITWEERFAKFLTKPVVCDHNEEEFEEEEEVDDMPVVQPFSHCDVIERKVEEYVPEEESYSPKQDSGETVVGFLKEAKSICLEQNDKTYETRKNALLDTVLMQGTDDTYQKVEAVFLADDQRRMKKEGTEVTLEVSEPELE